MASASRSGMEQGANGASGYWHCDAHLTYIHHYPQYGPVVHPHVDRWTTADLPTRSRPAKGSRKWLDDHPAKTETRK